MPRPPVSWTPMIGLLALLALPLSAPSEVGAQLQVSQTGSFHVIWGDAPSGSSGGSVTTYVLIDDQGQWMELLAAHDALARLGGPLRLDRKRVSVVGETAGAPFSPGLRRLRVQTLQVLQPQSLPAADQEARVSGSQKWVTILCRFADSPAVTPQPSSWFQTLMLGSTHPGLDHYWREQSYDAVNLVGSVVVGWYNLPRPRSYYLPGGALDHQRALQDCTGVADPDVFFPDFAGINLMFNQDLDCCAWGGSSTLTRDAQTKVYRVTWMPPWGYGDQAVIAHEMGHGFGLPHSSGPYSATYDSQWDVMSSAWGVCSPPDPEYGCIGMHTISYHKDVLGWIPPAQKFAYVPGTTRTLVLGRLAPPLSGANYLIASIPIAGSTTQFYTIETRHFAGYDAASHIHGEAIVIHRVDTTRGDRVAQVVDPDGNGNPNDAGAMWLPGEVFVTTDGIAIAIDARTASGFQITISSSSATRPKVHTVPPCRLVDTRVASAPFPEGAIPPHGSRSIAVTGSLAGTGQGGASTCGIPEGATGVFVNVVAVMAEGHGHLTLHPFGTALPLASTLNFGPGQTVANGVLVPICAPAASCPSELVAQMGPGGSHLVIDVTGYLRTVP